MPAQPCAVISDWTVCSCGCCSWTYAATIGCQGRSRDSRYTNQNYWSTWFFICLSGGLERLPMHLKDPSITFTTKNSWKLFYSRNINNCVNHRTRFWGYMPNWRAANFCLIIIIIKVSCARDSCMQLEHFHAHDYLNLSFHIWTIFWDEKQ